MTHMTALRARKVPTLCPNSRLTPAGFSEPAAAEAFFFLFVLAFSFCCTSSSLTLPVRLVRSVSALEGAYEPQVFAIRGGQSQGLGP